MRKPPSSSPGRDPAEAAGRPPPAGTFLPDFCAIPVVFSVVVMGELLAFVIVLLARSWTLAGLWPEGAVEPGAGGSGWDLLSELALTSLFVQWVGLGSVAVLCALRGRLARLSDLAAGLVAYALVVVLTALATAIGHWLLAARALDLALLAGGGGPGEPAPWLARHALAGGGELLARNTAVSAIVAAVGLRYLYVQHQWRQQTIREAEARFQALQSRIRPHFLFNSMNTIASFARSRPELAEQVVEDLAELFRVSLSDARAPVTLRRELELCRQYLRIEALRLGDRLRVQWELGDLPEDALLPALSLQPLVENAVYHGIEPSTGGGFVRVRQEPAAPGEVCLSLTNSVPAGGARRGEDAGERPGNRMALANVRERITAFFGARASVSVTARPREGAFEVTVRFPVVRERGPAADAAGGRGRGAA